MTEEQWGPWIEHDGQGCPCVGMFVEAKYRYAIVLWNGVTLPEITSPISARFFAAGGASWYAGAQNDITQYRIRKPKGLTILEEIAQGVKQPEGVE